MEEVEITVASKVPFSELCSTLEHINNARGMESKRKKLKEFVDKWRSFHNKVHKDKSPTVCDPKSKYSYCMFINEMNIYLAMHF